MKKKIFAAVTGLMVLILCGCGGGSGGSDSAATGSLKIANNTSSGLAVSYLYLSPASANNWGPDQLGTNQTIQSGSSFTFTNIPPGTYDSKVVLENNQVLYLYGFTITAGQTANNQVTSAFKAVGKTLENKDSLGTNINFTYITASENQGAPKESPDKAFNVSSQYVVEIVK